jgi:acyl-CoA synthetase (AMP-forming)/AMP-acid ligase II
MSGAEDTGLYANGRQRGWPEVHGQADRLAHDLRAATTARVLVEPEAGPELVVALLAASAAAVDLVVAAPHIPRSAVDALEPDHQLRTNPAGTTLVPRCSAWDVRRHPEPAGVWIFSSGTGGTPRATRWTWAELDRLAPLPGTAREERWGIGYAPFGFAGTAATWQALGRARWLEYMRPEDLRRRRNRPDELDVVTGTPSFWRMAVVWASGHQDSLRRIAVASAGGEPVDDGMVAAVRTTFSPARIKQIFGTTEFGTFLAIDDERGGLPVELCGRRLASGGAFDVHGDRLVVSSRPGAPFQETGDTVRIVGDRLVVVGRAGVLVNVGGYKVDPLVIGQALQEHPLVLAAQAYGLRSPILGQVIAVDVVADPTATVTGADLVRELKRFAATRLVQHQRPRRIRLVDAVRLSESGKLATHG